MSIFLTFYAGTYCSNILKKYLVITFWGIWGGLNVRMQVLVWICSPTFLMENLLIFVIPCFPRAVVVSFSVTKTNSLLQTISFAGFNLLWGYALDLVIRNIFIVRMLLACLWLFISTSKFLFLVFFTFLGVVRVAIIFAITKRENLFRQTSSKDSLTLNLEKAAASFSESYSKILFFFF